MTGDYNLSWGGMIVHTEFHSIPCRSYWDISVRTTELILALKEKSEGHTDPLR